MVVNNLSDRVYILFDEEESLNGGEYVVHKLDVYGCPIPEVQAQGVIIEDEVTLQLKDGAYQITVTLDSHPDFTGVFSVYYNSLPEIVNEISKVLCPCNICKEATLDELFKVAFRIHGFAISTNMICNSQSLTLIMYKYYKILTDAKKYQKYYGVFNFSYEKAIQDLLANFYIELYNMSTDQLGTSEKDLNTINAIYKIEFMEKCLYKLGYDFNDILCKINNSKCNCNE